MLRVVAAPETSKPATGVFVFGSEAAVVDKDLDAAFGVVIAKVVYVDLDAAFGVVIAKVAYVYIIYECMMLTGRFQCRSINFF